MDKELIDIIVEVIQEFDLDLTKVKITKESKIWDDLGLDSLDTVELMVALEERLDISIPDDVGKSWITIEDVVSSVEPIVEKAKHYDPEMFGTTYH